MKLNKDNAQLRSQLSQREYEVNERNRKDSYQTCQLETSKRQIEELKAECLDLRQAKYVISEEFNEQKLKLDSTEANSKRQKIKLQENEERIELLNGNLDERDRQIKTLNKDNAQLSSQLYQWEYEVSELSRKENDLRNQLETSKRQIEEKRAECLDLRQAKDVLSEEYNELKLKLDSSEANNKRQKTKTQEKEERIELFNGNLSERDQQIKTLNRENAQLRTLLCQREYEVSELSKTENDLKNQLETSKRQIEEVKASCLGLRQTKDVLSEEYNELKLKLDSTEAINKSQEIKLQEKEERIELMNGNLNERDRQIMKLNRENAQLHSELCQREYEVNELNRKDSYLTSQLETSKRQIEELKAECRDLRQAKDDLSDSLDESMSARLRNGNSDIADLSDEYRPTKLAEMYSELYDNEWTNAYSAMEEIDKPGRLIIMFLLDIFMDVYYFCCDEMDSMWISMERWFLNRYSPDYTKISKSLKDSRKINAVQMIKQIQKKYIDRLQNLCNESFTVVIEDDEVMSFIEKSVELGLMMAANDPPVYVCLPNWIPVCERKVPNTILDQEEQKDEINDDENDMDNNNNTDDSPNTDAAQNSETIANQRESHSILPKDNSSEGCNVVNALKAANQDANKQKEVTVEEPPQQENEPFDKNVYKEYTCRGRYLDYVAWPMLRLHKDGGVLSKGVAQGTKNSVKSEETYCWWKDFA